MGLEGCYFDGWANTLFVGDRRPDLAYLPVPKSGSTYLREALGPLLGWRYMRHDNATLCVPVDGGEEGVAAVRELFRGEAALGREVVANLVVQHGKKGDGRDEGKGTPGDGGNGDGDGDGGGSDGGGGGSDGAASSVCFAVRGAIHPRNQLNLASRDRRRAAFSLVTEPLRHLFHGLMFDVPHDDLDAAERAAVVAEPGRAAEAGAAVGLNASSDVVRFVRRAASLWRLCGAAASASGGAPARAPSPAPASAPSPARRARARVNVHRAPQAWHLSSVLRQIAESGGTTSLDGDRVWVLDDELPRGLPGLSALLGVPAIQGDGDSLSRRGAADALDQRMAGEEGWRLVQRHASRADFCAVCHVLRADYACLPFARPRACDGC